PRCWASQRLQAQFQLGRVRASTRWWRCGTNEVSGVRCRGVPLTATRRLEGCQCGSLRLSRRLTARRMNPAAAMTASAAKVGMQWIRKLMLCVLLLCLKDDPESNED